MNRVCIQSVAGLNDQTAPVCSMSKNKNKILYDRKCFIKKLHG